MATKEAKAQVEPAEVIPETETKAEVKPEAEVVKGETFTREDLDAVKAEAEKRVAGLNRVVSRKDEEIKRLQSQPVSQTPILRTLIEEMEAHPTQDEYGNAKPSPRLAELKRQVALAEQQERTERVKVYAQTKHQELVQQITDAGLDPNTEDFYPVEDAWEQGLYDVAKRRVERILAKKPKEEKVEKGKSEEEIRAEVDKRVKEELAKYKIQDVSSPGGGSLKPEDIIARYARGEASRAEYERATGKKSE